MNMIKNNSDNNDSNTINGESVISGDAGTHGSKELLLIKSTGFVLIRFVCCVSLFAFSSVFLIYFLIRAETYQQMLLMKLQLKRAMTIMKTIII